MNCEETTVPSINLSPSHTRFQHDFFRSQNRFPYYVRSPIYFHINHPQHSCYNDANVVWSILGQDYTEQKNLRTYLTNLDFCQLQLQHTVPTCSDQHFMFTYQHKSTTNNTSLYMMFIYTNTAVETRTVLKSGISQWQRSIYGHDFNGCHNCN